MVEQWMEETQGSWDAGVIFRAVLSHDARTQIRRDVDAKSAREWNDQWKTAAGGQWVL